MKEAGPFPRWRYHKTLAGRIVKSAEENEALGEGWEDSPAAFEVSEDVKRSEADVDGEKSALKDQNLVAMKNDELREILIEAGIAAADLKGLKKDELIAKIGEL